MCQKEFSIEEQFKRKLTFAESAQGISEEETLQTMADQESNGQVSADGQVSVDADAEVVERPKKNQTPAEPPVTFREFNVSTILVKRYVNLSRGIKRAKIMANDFILYFQHTKDFEDLVRTVVTMLSGEEQDRLREMEDWIIKNEGTWVLAEGFNTFLGMCTAFM